ncbi:MAG: hypothetical protein FJ108_10525 [Deltaproteobacteria bacterium]|nr:hypothetical protein [Deltaproteobacteria bacterium]
MSRRPLRAPIDRILPAIVPVLFERGIPGYATERLNAGELRIAPAPLRSLFIAAAIIGTLNVAAERGFDWKRVREILTRSIHTVDGVSPLEEQNAVDLVQRFHTYRFIRETHPFDDWICEALWSAFQTAQYEYPSAMSAAISYSLTVVKTLQHSTLEY